MVSLSQISACCQAAFEVFSLLCWPSQLLERSHLLPVELSKWTHWSKHFVLSPHCLLLSCAVRLTCSCNTPHRTQKLNFSLLYSQKPRGTSSSERLQINTFIMRYIPVTLIKGWAPAAGWWRRATMAWVGPGLHGQTSHHTRAAWHGCLGQGPTTHTTPKRLPFNPGTSRSEAVPALWAAKTGRSESEFIAF